MTKSIETTDQPTTQTVKHTPLTLKKSQLSKTSAVKRTAIHGRVVVGDISGSMSGRKLDGLKSAYRKVWAPGIIGIVFGTGVYEITSTDIDTLHTMGATNMMAALRESWSRDPKQIVLISDGEPTDAHEDTIIAEAVERKVRIDTIGIADGTGYSYNPEFMRELAHVTGGTFTDCNEPIELGGIVEFLLTQGGSSSLEEGQSTAAEEGGVIQL